MPIQSLNQPDLPWVDSSLDVYLGRARDCQVIWYLPVCTYLPRYNELSSRYDIR